MPSVLWTVGAALAVVGIGALLTLAVRAVVSAWWGWFLLPALLLVLLALQVDRRWVRRGAVLELDLDQRIVEVDSPVGFVVGGVPLRDVVDALDRAREDSRVVGLVARVGTGRIGPAQAEELREAVRRFSASGKKTVAWAETFGEGETALVPYYLATAFDEIWLQPSGEMNVSGLVSRRPFIRRLLDRISVTPEFDHRSEYKSAMYLFTEESAPEPEVEETEALLDSLYDTMVSGIAERRNLDVDMVRGLVDRGVLFPEEARDAGLVDRVGYRDEAYETVGADERSLLYLDRYLAKRGRSNRRGPLIALVYGVGDVVRGPGTPLRSQLAADDVSSAIREAARSKRVRGIVIRIDSPGGSAVASDVVWRAIERARAGGIPVVASMGDVAASGGYWVATACDRIVANRMTVTGSIGVVFGKFVTGEAWQRLGVTWEESRRGARAGWLSSQQPWTQDDRGLVSGYLDIVYDDFKRRVAVARNLPLDRVEEVARGRVWSGADAHTRGLVDALGGLDTAVEMAKQMAGISPDETVRVTSFPRSRRLQAPRRPENSETVGWRRTRWIPDLRPGIQSLRLRRPF